MLIPPSRTPLALAVGLAAIAGLAALALATGSFPVSPGEVADVLWSSIAGAPGETHGNARAVILEIRAPRILAALLVGASLGMAGAAYQNAFRNALVSPDILGVSSGCALGAVAAILLGLPLVLMQAMSFAGGLAAAGLVFAVGAFVRGHDRVLTLVLTGVVVGALFAAGVAFAKALADPYNELPAITFWLLGSFGGVVPRDLVLAAPLMLLGAAPLMLLRWRVNLLALPDDEARALGVNVPRLRLGVVAAATLLTSTSVALAGVIGWVGLIVPHAARLVAGPGFTRVLPLSAVLGAAFLLLVDTLTRTLAPSELPPGIVTAIVGTPAFIVLLAAAARRDP